MNPGLYLISRGSPDLNIFEIIFPGGVGMILIIFAHYCAGMGIHLDPDVTGAPALDSLTVDLPFTHCLFHVTGFPARFVTRAQICLAY